MTKCNNGLHFALYNDYRGAWYCMVCKEKIDIQKVKSLRKKNRESLEEELNKDEVTEGGENGSKK